MKRILSIILIISSLGLSAQTILKGKTLSNRLNEIETLIKQKRFESAIELFESKSEIISLEKVKTKEINIYNYIKSFVSNKKIEFEKSDNEFKNWEILFNNNDYEKLQYVFSFNLKPDIFKSETYKKYIELEQFLIEWEEQYNNYYKTINNPRLF